MTSILAIDNKPAVASTLPSASTRPQNAPSPRTEQVATSTTKSKASEAPPPSQPTPSQVVSKLEQVQQAIEKVKQSIKPELANSLDFRIDEGSGKTVVKILDAETNTVIRQIPSEEMMAIAEAIEYMQGRGGLVKQAV